MPEPEFDLDAWIDGVQPSVGTVDINQRGDIIAEIEALEDDLEQAERAQAEEVKDERLASKPGLSRKATGLAKQIATLHEQIEGSWLTVKMKSLSLGKWNELEAEHEGDFIEWACQSMALQIVDVYPRGGEAGAGRTMTAKQLHALHDRIGASQFGMMWAKARYLTVGPVVTPDLSSSVLRSLGDKDS